VESREVFLDDESADAAGTLAGIGDREDGDQVGDGAVGDPNFIAVEGVVIAAFLRAATHRTRGIRAAARFGQRVGADLRAGRKRREIF